MFSRTRLAQELSTSKDEEEDTDGFVLPTIFHQGTTGISLTKLFILPIKHVTVIVDAGRGVSP